MVHDDAPRPIREALTAGHLAHLVTINSDGSPHVTIVWIGLEGDEIVSGHLPFHRKLRNVQRDPRVSLSIEVGGHNEMGLANYLVVEGTARITEGGAAGLLQLADGRLGRQPSLPPADSQESANEWRNWCGCRPGEPTEVPRPATTWNSPDGVSTDQRDHLHRRDLLGGLLHEYQRAA